METPAEKRRRIWATYHQETEWAEEVFDKAVAPAQRVYIKVTAPAKEVLSRAYVRAREARDSALARLDRLDKIREEK